MILQVMLDVQSHKKGDKASCCAGGRSIIAIWLVFRWEAAAGVTNTGAPAFSAPCCSQKELDGSGFVATRPGPPPFPPTSPISRSAPALAVFLFTYYPIKQAIGHSSNRAGHACLRIRGSRVASMPLPPGCALCWGTSHMASA